MKSSLRYSLLPLTLLCFCLLMVNQCECRHLPTRGQTDNLEKLRELMYQILESSNENLDERSNNNPNNLYSLLSKQQQQQQNLFSDSGIPPQLLMSSKSRYGHNNFDNNSRMF